MAEPTGSVVTPSAPTNGAPQPQAAPQAPKRLRISEMAQGLEQANEVADRRAVDTERRLARPDPRAELQSEVREPDAPPDALPEFDTPEAPVEGDPAQIATADQKLFDRVKEWRETGEVPEDIWKLPLSWVDKNGNLVEETLEGLKERGMRLSDYHREMGRLKTRDREHEVVRGNINTFFNDIRDPAKFLEEFEDRGYGDVIHQVAVLHSQRISADKRIAEAAGLQVMQQYGCDGRDNRVVDAMRTTMARLKAARATETSNRLLQKQQQQVQAQGQQQQTQADTQQRMQALGNSLQQLVPVAFKATGVRTSPANVNRFYQHLGAVVDNIPNWDGTYRRVHCLQAARILAEELQDYAASTRAAPAPNKSKALSPGRTSPSGKAVPVGPERKRISDMANDPRFRFGMG